MATPHVAGVAAVIATRNPGATASSLRSKLDASVDDLGTAGRDTLVRLRPREPAEGRLGYGTGSALS